MLRSFAIRPALTLVLAPIVAMLLASGCDTGTARRYPGTTPPGGGSGGSGGGDTSSRPRGEVVEVTLGADHGCARYKGGQLRCWGGNAFGQLGNGTNEPALEAIDATDFGVVTQIAAGDGFTCAMVDDGSVWCFGRNEDGQLGDGNGGPGRGSSNRAVQVRGLNDVTSLVAGKSHACALRKGGAVVCWGVNAAGQMGENGAIRATGQYARNADGAGSRAARKRNAAAPFPRPHRHLARRFHANEMDVDPAGKRHVVLDLRADGFRRLDPVAIDKNHRVRVAHAHTRRGVGSAVDD